jgi:hypothetical protein
MISYFLGANAPGGFHSLYDRLMDEERAQAVYILKGGPGCGKSTLMGRLAQRAEAAGEPVEYVFCSGDPDSLDAILLPRRRVAVADGTAPHVLEPMLPGVVGHYVNLEVCCDPTGLAPLREEIARLTREYKACYPRAYRCLSAAGDISFNCRSLLACPRLEEGLARRGKSLAARHLHRPGNQEGILRHRFLSAITCQGEKHLWETVTHQCRQVIGLEDTYGLASPLLERLASTASAAGHDGVLCLDPMFPGRAAHLLLPDLELAFVTTTSRQPYPGKLTRRVHIDALVGPDLLRRFRPRLRFSRKISDALTEEAIASLRQAKALHDQLEALYNPHVDFQQVHAMGDALAHTLGF